MTVTPPKTARPLLIGSQWSDADRPSIEVFNPATGRVIADVPEATLADADAAMEAAHLAFVNETWSKTSFTERAAILERVADELEARASELADLYVQDLGGVAMFAPHITAQAVLVLRGTAELADKLSAEPEVRETVSGQALIYREPMGPVVAVVPWNAPLVLTMVKIAPALLAGCPVVVKVDPVAPLVSQVLADIFASLDLPAGVISFLPGGRQLGEHLVSHPRTAHVSFTGSTTSGQNVLRASAHHFARTTLELGGKSAAIVLDDIEPSAAIPMLVGACLAQSGQVCTTSSRVLVPASRKDEWIAALTAAFSSLPVGDPADPQTVIGPLATSAQRDRVEGFIAQARSEGATVLTGGGRPSGHEDGYFVEPTLITDVTNDMQIVRDEVFGPVIVVQTYRDDDEAVDITNDTIYGLANGVFGHDLERAGSIARRLRSGTVNVNGSGANLTAPFGGYKASGIGREGGIESVYSFLELKQVNVAQPLATS
ncbi:MAG: aldehyde dehydrogenase [Gordonia sp.]|nr:aldehyde dehydrogenase [Gordonia sp. (in: high G+C Gram-positive bacteria)]